MKLFVALFTLIALLPLSGQSQNESYSVTVQITNLRNTNGDIHIALFNTPGTFPDSDGMISEQIISASPPAQAIFSDLKPGAYALAVYHDENANHEFDQGFLGIPLEGYAFSNGAKAFLGPPSFREAKISLSGSDVSLTIPMDY